MNHPNGEEYGEEKSFVCTKIWRQHNGPTRPRREIFATVAAAVCNLPIYTCGRSLGHAGKNARACP